MIVAGGGNVARGMRGPRDAVNARAMIRQTRDGRARYTYVKNDHLNGGDERLKKGYRDRWRARYAHARWFDKRATGVHGTRTCQE